MKKTICTLLSILMILSILASCAGQSEEVTLAKFADDSPEDVSAMIDAITEASFENETAIDAAYAAYNTLNDEEKAKVTNYEKLETLLNDLATMYNTSARRGDRMNRNQILLGTYCFYFNDEEHIKEFADAGFDYITAVGYNYDQARFDLFEKYDIGVLLSGLPQWRGNDRLPEDPQPEPTFDMNYYADVLKTVVDHEAIWGIDIIDEPSALDFPFVGQQVDTIYDVLPGYLAYVNLHPLHGRARLGVYNEVAVTGNHHADYREYIANYVKDIDTDYICYDHYFYQNGNSDKDMELEKALFLQKTVSEACDKNDKDFWIVLQVNSRNDNTAPPKPLDQRMLQIQAFMALSFGARAINWACWQPGWWSYNIYDSEGNRTEQYEKVAAVNEDIKRISPIYIRYKHIDTCSISRNDQECGAMTQYFDNEFGDIEFKNLKADGKSFVIAGYFEKNVGSKGSAMMFTNLSDHLCKDIYPNIATITFEVDDPDAVVTAYIMGYPKVLTPENGVYTVTIENAEYAFVTIE